MPLIVADDSVAVVKVYQGTAGATISMRTIGGTADEVRMVFLPINTISSRVRSTSSSWRRSTGRRRRAQSGSLRRWQKVKGSLSRALAEAL